MEFRIDPTSRVPIYRQLGDQIREAVARGRLAAGERLPSVREMSRSLVVNPNTIARVFTELERDGVLNTRPGFGGFRRTPRDDRTRKVRRERLVQLTDRFLTEAVHLGFSADEVTSLVSERSRQFRWQGDAHV